MYQASVKKISAIICSLLLVWMQFAPTLATASSLPLCQSQPVCHDSCCHSGADCCLSHSKSNSQPSPATPAPASAQNQVLIFASALILWTSPENTTSPVSTTSASPASSMAATPLFVRNCTLLL